jgi:hypothetical protein
MPGGNYSVKVVAVAEGEETHEFSSEEETFEIINYCSTMFDMFKDAYNTEVGDDEYRAIFDLNGDGFINIVDFAMFAPFYNNQTWCQEQIEPVEEGYCLDVFSLFEDSYNSVLGDENYDSRFDLNGDDAINIEDFAIFGDNYGDEDWCKELLYPTIENNNNNNPGGSSGSHSSSLPPIFEEPLPFDLEEPEKDNLNKGRSELDVPVEQNTGLLGITGAAITEAIGGNPGISTLVLILLILVYMQIFTKRKPLKGFKK